LRPHPDSELELDWNYFAKVVLDMRLVAEMDLVGMMAMHWRHMGIVTKMAVNFAYNKEGYDFLNEEQLMRSELHLLFSC